MKAKELLKACEECYSSFNPNLCTEDSHAVAFLNDRRILEAADRQFIQQVFYGCTRYKGLLEVVILAYLKAHHRMKSDFARFLIVGYLALLRLGELSVADFRKLLTGILTASINAEYLRFIFSLQNVEVLFREGWLGLYDDDFVGTLTQHIDAFKDEVLQLADEMDQFALAQREKAQNATVATKKPLTQSQPFNITKPRPRLVPDPEPLPAFVRPPTPEETVTAEARQAIEDYKRGKKGSTLDRNLQRKNREREAAVPMRPPKMRCWNRPSNLDAVREQMEVELSKACEPESWNIKGPEQVRKMMARTAPAEARLTNAAILREDATYRRIHEDELKELHKKETELRDSSEFYQWKAQMDEQDKAERDALIARRKVEAMLIDENAKAANRERVAKNQEEGRKYREGHNKLLERNAAEHEAMHRAKQEKAAELNVVLADGVAKAKETVRKHRTDRATEVKQLSQQNEIRLAQLMELERQRRQEVINEIRALETREGRGVYKAHFDPSTTSDHGMLAEMSMLQLKERLREMEEAEAKRLAEQNDKIKSKKAEAAAAQAERVEHIRQNRARIAAAKSAKRMEIVAEREETQKVKLAKEEKDVLELQAKLQEKRQARQQAEQERKQGEKERRIKAQLLSADKAAIEVKKWEEMEKGAEKIVKGTQRKKLDDASVGKQVAVKRGNEQRRQLRNKQRATRERQRVAEDNLKVLKDISVTQDEVEAHLLRSAVLGERQRKQQMIQLKLDAIGTARDKTLQKHSMSL